MAEQAADSGDHKELSMEEILQSIRKIIAEDGDEAKDTEDKIAIVTDEAVPGSDVLELTEMLNDDGTVVSLKTEPSADILDTIDEALTAKAQPAPPPTPTVQKPAIPEDSLLSDEAASAASNALRRLRTAEAPVHHPAPSSESFRSGTTIEDLVAEMLRPMMKTWLDTHLPAIVERIVEKEVQKLSH